MNKAHPRRIMIIGTAGSGKSTLARMLGDALDLPVYHMDRDVHWLPGWVERAEAERYRIVQEIVAKEEWVFEGGYSRTYPIRAARAEMLIWLQVPVWKRVPRVILRTLRNLGKFRPDAAEGCPEQLSNLPDFLNFIFRTRVASNAKQKKFFEASSLPKARLTTFAETRAFIEGLIPKARRA